MPLNNSICEIADLAIADIKSNYWNKNAHLGATLNDTLGNRSLSDAIILQVRDWHVNQTRCLSPPCWPTTFQTQF